MNINQIIHGNCLEKLLEIDSDSIDMIYFDPPFFTQKNHSLLNRENTKLYEFSDKFDSITQYLDLIKTVLIQCKRVLKETGSVFLHCDRTASHSIRVVLDEVFHANNFQSEIVWSYKRWSNSKKGLLNSHQIIFFYSKSSEYKFNILYTNYSPTTNVDQIWQERKRDKNGKSIYKKDVNGNTVLGKEKKGVPLSDVWEIPYLNPKAKERTGYPTQKPVLLLNQIINISTNEGDLVLDPFCGSGTTCVSAKLLNRKYIGIDISKDAVDLTKSRLKEMVITESNLLKKGVSNYLEKSDYELELLKSINAIPVQRNTGIDGFLKEHFDNSPVPVKIQRENESLEDAIEKLERASKGKNYSLKILLQTKESVKNYLFSFESEIKIIKTTRLQIKEIFKRPVVQDIVNK